jgi:gamma-glutamylcyclotransferase (GGCT)/AIG2-like uncharacterized protein YtfP
MLCFYDCVSLENSSLIYILIMCKYIIGKYKMNEPTVKDRVLAALNKVNSLSTYRVGKDARTDFQTANIYLYKLKDEGKVQLDAEGRWRKTE